MRKLRAGMFSKLTLWMLASPFILLIAASLLAESAEARARHNTGYASVAALKSRLAFPKSIMVDAGRVPDAGAACIQYRTHDGYGVQDRAQAVVVEGAVTQSGSRDGRFEKAWSRQCLGLSYDVTEAVDRFF